MIERNNKATYFASDFHFGVPNYEESKKRERIFISWLDEIKSDASAIYLMGDLFDFWFEYKTVVPKGYTRLLGKLAELTDCGIEIHLFKGNHDLWAFEYLQKEIGIHLHRKPEVITLQNKKFFLAHGDGLGPGDKGYKFLKATFENKINQFLYRWIHPDIGTRLGSYFSRRSRLTKILNGEGSEQRRNKVENEPMVIFSKEMAKNDTTIDYYIFGHVHFPDIIDVSTKAKCIILGDWVNKFTFARFNGEIIELLKYKH